MSTSFLSDIRVLELADERGEYCGRLLAGAGADVIKVEPPDGSPTRRIGPFIDDVEDPERSLHFWHYCFGKRSITLDITTPSGQENLKRLVATADVVLESYEPGTLDGLGLGRTATGRAQTSSTSQWAAW
jgi:crotonobetainyl-CoA:carnitine CoA-transferase CaiB-like acyl-CoA transferase